MKPGLVTLADLPALAAGKSPSTTIVVARLDDKLRDPRYGAFKITQADVDGWQRNLADTFGGRVSIDFDHSSDRGGGTRAAAWITGLHQDGRLVTADVEFTPKGAKAVRDGYYKYISPTFVNDFKDEHGESHGKALIGAALTNRPVLRKGMPCLSLSRDSFAGVATPRPRKTKNGRPMSKKNKSRTLSQKAARKAGKKLMEGPRRAHAEMLLTLARLGPEMLGRVAPGANRDAILALANATPGASAETVITLAQYAPAGVAHAGTIDWQPPAADAAREPGGLDDSGRALHALIAARAASTGQPFFHAMAAVTGIPDYRDLSDVPTTPVQQQGLDPERAALDASGRALAASAGIGWFDAMEYLDQQLQLAELQRDDGSASVPWLDSRPVATPPRPWSDDDWARDQRRASAAGVDIDKNAWQAGAEQGRDVVGEQADALRAGAIANHRQRGEGLLDQARAREDIKRSTAINDELTRRARNRVAANGNGR